MIHWLPPTYMTDMARPNASNSPIRIKIRRGALYPGAILAQERYEWEVKFPLFLLGFLPVLLVSFGPGARWIEIGGHAVEVAAAVRYYGVIDVDAYEEKEARGLAGYPQFSGWSVVKIQAGLKQRRGKAARWVKRRHGLITKYMMAFSF